MKTGIKIGVIAAFVLTGISWLLSTTTQAEIARDGTQANPNKISPRSLYTQNCARCHGANGKAQTTLGKKLEAKDISGGISSAKVIRTVTNGKGDMPSFKKKLTKAQIESIAAYVRSL